MSLQVQPWARIPTARLIAAAFALVLFAIVLDEAKRPLYANARILAHIMDCAAAVVGWTGLVALCAGLVIGPFRPKGEFSLHGLYRERAVNFAFAFGALALVILYQAVRIGWMLFR